ncbi:MAG: hypothetical protein AAGE05_04350 [Pseudomonadota bacterium]
MSHIIMHMLCLVGIPAAIVVIVCGFTDASDYAGYAHGDARDDAPRGLSDTDEPNHG